MAAELRQAKKVRASILGLLTREKRKLFEDNGTLREVDLGHHSYSVILGLIEDYYQRFTQADEKVILLELDANEEEGDEAEVSDASVRFYSEYALIKSTLLSFIEETSPKSEERSNNTMTHSSKPIRLPKLEVPKFSGSYSAWMDFKNEFESLIINNSDLKDVDRFRFLKSSLLEGPKRIISSMEVSEENFGKAWQALKDRYDNVSLIFRSHINELVSIQPVATSTSEKYRELLDIAQAHIRSLLTLGSEANIAENIIICLMLSKLDAKAQAKWEETSTNEIATWTQFATFLEKYASTLEKVDQTRQQVPRATSTPKKASSSTRSHSFVAATKSSACLKCKATNHLLKDCPSFCAMSPYSRFKEVKSLKGCVRCLAPHSSRSCNAVCVKCKGYHHTLLHFADSHTTAGTPVANGSNQYTSNQSASNQVALNQPVISSAVSRNQSLMASCSLDEDKSLLASVLIFVLADSGVLVPCHALLDSGSTDNYITDRFVMTINSKKFNYKHNNEVSGIGCTSASANYYTFIKFSSQHEDLNYTIKANILPKITEVYPVATINTSTWNIPKNIKLADPHFDTPKRIDLLIGAGLFWSLLRPDRTSLGPGLPYLQHTELGWVVVGTVTSANVNHHRSFVANIKNSEESLNELVERFWELDKVPETTKILSAQDQQCEDYYNENTLRDSSGRYIVKLPFCDSTSKLGKSLDTAMKRFLNLERRLQRQPDLKKMYTDFIDEYERLGHLEILNEFDCSEPHYFIPHHCVMKLTSSTTKLRVVFDASCKTSSGFSLNDILHTGPQLQDDLFTLLLKFRLYKYVATCDIQKMYRQIRINPPDANFQLILWRKDPTEPVKILRLLTVTYGTGPGAYLAIKSLRQLAEDEGHNFPIGAELLMNNFYVDDAMIGGNSISDLSDKLDQLKSILELGGFNLGKYCSNSTEILAKFPIELQEKFLKIDQHEVMKALGLLWQPDADVFRYTYSPGQSEIHITKRTVLSQIAKVFDPLGFICPVLTMAKIFYQTLWALKLEWDDPLPTEYELKWRKFNEQLINLKSISIQRYACSNNYKSIELHGFSDASEKAYGACVYLRCRQIDDSYSTSLLCAKSRVAPTKTITIARLELCAAKLLIELMFKLKNEVLSEIEFSYIHYWTDSLIVLHWLSAEPHNWSTFVAHRVTKIQEFSTRQQWRHVPGKFNPADLISRGVLPSEISKSSLWWHGPDFLLNSIQEWPIDASIPRSLLEIEEFRAVKHSLIAIKQDDLTNQMQFSVSFRGTRRVFAYVLRFICRCRNPVLSKTERSRKVNSITYSEIETPTLEEETRAEEAFIKIIQQTSFPCEYHALINQKPLNKKSTLIKLSPFIDASGLLRVGGRLKRAHLPYDAKHQILLPKNHQFTQSLISYFHHKRVCHAGVHTTLSAIRSRYWPIGGLQLTRKVIFKCIWCFRLRPKFSAQLMADLPLDRIEPNDYRPFAVSGVDFAGPISVRHHVRCKQSKEVHLALFICFVTKAVHVELVTDLSTEAFLRALRRFIADRGKIVKMYSDNAKNFLGACNYLKSIKEMLTSNSSEIQQECSKHHIDWSFIPPRAPNHGGLWEASIKILKRLIKNAVGSMNLTEDELRTVSKHASAIINSRPITTVSNDPNDLNPLTPGHFIFGGPPAAFPEPIFDLTQVENVNKIHLYQRMQFANQILWKRFYHEYLHLLQARSKWCALNNSFTQGAVVILKEQNSDPLSWRLGRIIGTTPDSNGVVRIIRVKTAQGEYDRAINSIAVLPDVIQQC